MAAADILEDINSTLASPAPQPASGAPSVAANNGGLLDDINGALAGNSPPAPKASENPEYVKRVAAGVNSGLIADTLGAPVDIATAAMNLVPRAVNTAGQALGYSPNAPLIDNPVGGSEWINQQMGRAGIGTKGIAPPSTVGERVAEAAGEGIGQMVGPNVAAKAHLVSGIVGSGARAIEESLAAGSAPVNAGIGAVSGAVGQGASEVVPEPYKPLAYMAGSFLPGAGLATGAATVSALGRGAGALYDRLPPLTATSREAAASSNAADRFRGAASDASDAINNIETAPRELVPGSLPTTAELSGDVGLLGAQRYREANNPELGRDVLERRVDNATARLSLLESQAPQTASIEDTQKALRTHLANIDADGDQAIEAARRNASQALPTATMLPEQQGAAARGAIEAERAPQGAALAAGEQEAQEGLNRATGAFGGQEALGSPETAGQAPAAYGAAMRDPVAQAYAAERQRLDAVRNSIDPTNSMGMKPDPIKQAVAKIGEMFPAEGGAQLSGAERNLYDAAQSWGSLIPVDRAFQLRANINGRIRGLQGSDPQEALRLGILKDGVDDAITNAVNDISVGEQKGVIHQGLPGIDDRIGGLANELGLGPSFTQDVARAYANNPATLRAAGRDETGRGILEAADSGNDSLRTGALPDRSGGRGQNQGRPGNSSGDQSLPQNPGEQQLTPLTQEARDRFAEWNAGYRAMGQKFRGETPGTLHAVGKILQKGGAYDSYRLTDAEVPWQFVNRNPNSRQAVDRFLAAAPAEAHGALDDAMAFSLRRTAQKADGTLDLPKYERWLKDHGAALSARPELAQRFNTAAQAQRRLDDIRQALVQHAAEHPLKPGWSDASVLPRYFKAGPEGAESMRQYMRQAGLRPEAVDAAVDHAAFSFGQAAVRNGEVNPRLAETWLRNHDAALSAVPGLKDKFTNAVDAQHTLERAMEAHETARHEYTQSVAGAFLQDDPDKAISRVFTGSNRQQKAALLMDLTRGNTAATEGLQRAAIDHMRSRFESATGDLTPKRFGDFVDQNRQVLSTLFPGRIGNFDALVQDLERGSQVQRARINAGGSDTAELTAGRDHGGHGTDVGTAMTAILAERVGEHISHHLGHLAGTIGTVGAVAGRILLGKARQALQVREDALFDRMLLDPDFAVEMNKANPARAKQPVDSIAARLRGRLVQQAIASARGAGVQ